mgnify:CR=1 FL=1
MKEVKNSGSLKDIEFLPDDDFSSKIKLNFEEVLEKHSDKAEIIFKSACYLLRLNSNRIMIKTLENLIPLLEEADLEGIEKTNEFLIHCSKCGIFGQFFFDIAFLYRETATIIQSLSRLKQSLENLKEKTNKSVVQEHIDKIQNLLGFIDKTHKHLEIILVYKDKNIHMPMTKTAGINDYITLSEKLTNTQNLGLLVVELENIKQNFFNK